jgi:hypothetical protein
MRILFLVVICTTLCHAQYQILSKNTGSKTTIVTTWTDGYVINSSGIRFEGQIQLKVVNNDTVEVRYRNSKKEKVEYKRSEIKSFGRMIDPTAHLSKNPRFNFQQGYVTLRNGTKLEGKIRTNNAIPNGSQVSFPDVIQYADAQNNLKEFNNLQATGASFMIGSTEVSYEKFENGFLEQLVKGSLIVLHNPHPTTQAEFATDVAKAIDSAVTKKPSEAVVMREEFLVHKADDMNYTAITPHNHQSWVENLMSSCKDFSVIDHTTRSKMLTWSGWMEAVRFYNEHCK